MVEAAGIEPAVSQGEPLNLDADLRHRILTCHLLSV
jgi:hypothetical protein